MPIYEYHCGKCHSEFELLVRSQRAANVPQLRRRAVGKTIERAGSPEYRQR